MITDVWLQTTWKQQTNCLKTQSLCYYQQCHENECPLRESKYYNKYQLKPYYNRTWTADSYWSILSIWNKQRRYLTILKKNF